MAATGRTARGVRRRRGIRGAALCAAILLGTLPAAADPAESSFQAGKKAFADGFYPLALASFRQVLDGEPGSARAEESAYLLGVTAFYAEQYELCLSALSPFPRKYPASALCRRIPYWVGAAHFRLGRYDRALESFRDQISRFPDESYYALHARLLAGISLEELDRAAEAGPFYKAVTEGGAASLWPEACYRLANCEYREGRFQAAFALYMKVVMDYPKSPFLADALFYLGECAFGLGNPTEAEKRYRTVLSEYPESEYAEQAAFRLAEIRYRDGRLSEAFSMTDKLKAAHPASVYTGRALRMRADAMFDQGRYAESNAFYAQCIPLLTGGEEKQGAQYNAALSLALSGRKEEAFLFYERAISGPATETAEKAMYRLAALKAELGRDADAVGVLERFLRDYPRSAHAEEAGRLLASLEEKAGDWARARERWDWLAARFAKSAELAEYVFRRGNAAFLLDREVEALQDYARILKDFPESDRAAEAAYAGGFLYSRRGEYSRAVPFFRAAVDAAGGRPVAGKALYSLGACYLALGEYELGGASFDRLLASAPQQDLRASALVGRGKVLFRRENYTEAARSFRDAAGLPVPAAAEALYWLGTALARQGDHREAEEAFVSLARRFPADPSCQEALFRAGLSAAAQGDDGKAASHFQEAAVLQGGAAPVREQALSELGWAQARLGLERECAETFERLAVEYPKGILAAEAFYKRAHALFAAKSYTDARAAFLEVARRFPDAQAAEQSRYWAARCSLDAGTPADAARAFWDCLEASPDGSFSAAAADGLVESLSAAGDPALAQGYYRKSLDSRTLSASVRQRLALEYARALAFGTPDQALKVLQEIRRQAPLEPILGETALLMGVCYAAQGDARRASETFTALYQDRRDGVAARAMGQQAQLLSTMAREGEAYDLYLQLAYTFPDRGEMAAEALYRAALIARKRGDAPGMRAIQAKLEGEHAQSTWTAKLKENP